MTTPNLKNLILKLINLVNLVLKNLKNIIKLSANESALGMSPKVKKNYIK